MTREEAITVLKAFMENPLFSDVHKTAFNIAIHDIKQRHDWDIDKLILVPKTEWEQEPTTKNDCKTCIHNKGVLECDIYGCEYEPTTKNDIAVECKVEDYINKRELIQKGMMGCDANGKMLFFIDAKELDSLPSITPKNDNSVVKDIKSEIQRFKDITSDLNEIHTIDYILSTFDKHISGKEQ